MAVSFKPCDAVIGAEVEGLSLDAVPDAPAIEALEAGLERFGILIFRDQEVSPEQQVAFSRALGPLEMTQRIDARLPGLKEIFIVGNTIDPPVTFSPAEEGDELEWHTDHIHLEVPARASLLYAKAVPASGGDTLFACMYSAYESLTPAQQSEYDGLRVVNSVSGLRAYLKGQGHHGTSKQRYEKPDMAVVRPLVRRHPLTGRKALYFGNQVSVGIVGWDAAEARGFILGLTEQACQPAFRYRHRWRVGDAVLWDNRRVLHAGTPYDMARDTRLMHRTTLRETAPVV